MRSHLQHRKDGNHDEMLRDARELFLAVDDHHNQDVGYDLMVMTKRGTVKLIEIKDPRLPPSKRRLTPKEQLTAARWGDCFQVAETKADLLRIAEML